MINRNNNRNLDHFDVQSSSIKTVGYDKESGDMHVNFHDTGRYVYHGVPLDVYQGFMMSSSKGNFLHANVKNRFAFTKL